MKVSDDGAENARENRRREDQIKNSRKVKTTNRAQSPDTVAKKLGFKKGL